MPASKQSRFTETTWDSVAGVRGTLYPDNAPRSWERESDIAADFFEATEDYSRLTEREVNTLVTAVATGLPLVITHDRELLGRIERTTRTYIVHELRPGANIVDNVRVSCWGFHFPLSLSSIVSVAAPETSWETVEAPDASECPGHPAGEFDAMGQTTYCNGSCEV